MLFQKLDLPDTTFIRGLAILLIMLHNYFHILDNAPGENEFSFSIINTNNFLNNLIAAPYDLFRQAFSFFGHYGVQLFVFLSGYGLARREATDPDKNYLEHFSRRFRKVYPVLFFAVAFLFLYKLAVTLLFPSKEIDLMSFAHQAFLKLTLVSNIIPGEALSISGPWWFFSMIIQLYLVATFLLKLHNKNYLFAFIFGSWLLQLLLLAVNAPEAVAYLRLNFPGHLPEFCLGIYIAVAGIRKLPATALLLFFALFLMGFFSTYAWVISFISVPILGIAFYRYLQPYLNKSFQKIIIYFGKNSLYLFAIHGLCRAPFVPLGNKSILWSIAGAILFLIVATALAMIFKFVLNSILKLAHDN